MNLLSDLRVLNDGVSTVGGQYLNNNLGGLDVINVNLLNRNGGRNSSGNLSGNSSGGRNSSGGNLNRNSYGDQLNPLNGNSKNNNARNHSLVPQIHANMPPIRKSNRKALLIPPPQITYSTTNSTISTTCQS
eukprot:518141_1